MSVGVDTVFVRILRRSFLAGVLASLAIGLLAPSASAEPFALDDIRYWVGSGSNRAALVVDWFEDSSDPPALAWGYRWEGAATGADMLGAILAADARLFAKLGGPAGSPARLFGLGYDANDDGQFALDDGTTFDAQGIALTGSAGLAAAIDPGDYYAEGWHTAFWHYGIASGNPFDGDAWADSVSGMAGRQLSDGAWDSWVFSPTFDFASFAENPHAALPPLAPLPGDFNGDGVVDGADYTRWKDSFGSIEDLAADGNSNGIVDAADYTLWRKNFSGAGSANVAAGVPEPPTWLLLATAAGSLCFRHRPQPRRTLV